MARAVRTELEGLQPESALSARASIEDTRRGTVKAEKVFALVSRVDHKQALKAAKGYGLSPVPVAPTALRPGQSPDAHRKGIV